MGIRADHNIARYDQALLREQRMLDAHLSDIKEIRDLVLVGKIADALTVFCTLNILIRHEVVHDQGDLLLIKNAFCLKLIHFMDGYR